GEWLPGMGERGPHPIFLTLGGVRGFDRLVSAHSRTFYQTWLDATLGAKGLLPQKAEEDIYKAGIDALVSVGIFIRVNGQLGDVIGLNPEALVLETELARLISNQGKRQLTVPADAVQALIGMPCLDAPQESYTEVGEPGGWFAKRFSRGDLRRVFSAEHT